MTTERAHKQKKPREPGTRALLDALAAGDPEEVLTLRHVLADLGRSTFGMLLMVATLPAFIPIPGLAGALSGPLVMLVGAQLLFMLRKPWLPGFLADRGPHRKLLVSFNQRISPWLARLEHLVKPRLTGVLDHPLASLFTGLLLVLLGLLLSLPIPFTNYLFGALMFAFAFALLERDGALMLLAWAAGIVAIGFFGILSGNLVAMATRWFDSLF